MDTYREYIERIKKLKNELISQQVRLKETSNKHADNVLEDFENELSKYLRVEVIKKGGFSTWIGKNDVKVFLLPNDDYGYRLHVRNLEDEVMLYVHTVYKYNGKWRDGADWVYWPVEKSTLENDVKGYVEKLKKQNIKRKDDAEKRELKKMVKKYNV